MFRTAWVAPGMENFLEYDAKYHSWELRPRPNPSEMKSCSWIMNQVQVSPQNDQPKAVVTHNPIQNGSNNPPECTEELFNESSETCT